MAEGAIQTSHWNSGPGWPKIKDVVNMSRLGRSTPGRLIS
jgi:hypothetical protein